MNSEQMLEVARDFVARAEHIADYDDDADIYERLCLLIRCIPVEAARVYLHAIHMVEEPEQRMSWVCAARLVEHYEDERDMDALPDDEYDEYRRALSFMTSATPVTKGDETDATPN